METGVVLLRRIAVVELSKERIDKILHEETVKTEEPATILRSIYARYMRLYEKYLADIDGLDDAKVAMFRKYHEVTKSLVKYYYMDIPQDTCIGLREFDNDYSANLLGPGWREYLFDKYEEFKGQYRNEGKGEDQLKAEFTKQSLEAFYDAMDYIFREGFGTGSQTAKSVLSGIKGLLFGE